MLQTRKVIKPRFYIICALLILIVVASIHISNGSNHVESASLNLNNIHIYETEYEDLRYGFTVEDIYLLAQLLCGDGRIDGDGEYDIDFRDEIDYYEVGKVLGVVMNRVRSDEFPNTVTDVVLQKGQFAVIPRNLNAHPSDIALATVCEWCVAYDHYINLVQVVPRDHLYFTGNGVINKTRVSYK